MDEMEAKTKSRLRNLTIPEMMFFAVWTFYSAYYALLSSSALSRDYYNTVSQLSKFCRYTTLALLIITFLTDAIIVRIWSRRQLLWYLAFLIIISIVEIRITDVSLLLIVLFIYTAQAIDYGRLLRYDIKLKICFGLIIMTMCAFGILQNLTPTINGADKMALGFSHPNTLACYTLTILIEWLCIRFKKMKWYDWVGIISVLFVIYEVSKSRTFVYTFAVILILYFIANYWQRLFQTKVVRIILTAIPAFMAFLSFYTVYLYSKGNAFAKELNQILTGRLSLNYAALSVKGIKWFGQEIIYNSQAHPYDNQTSFLIDNAYVRMALSWGAVLACIIIIIFMIRFFKWSKTGQIGILLMGLYFIVFGFAESYMTNIFYNLTLLCIFGIPCCNYLSEKGRSLSDCCDKNSYSRAVRKIKWIF